jgi:hypothetical protein
VAANCGGEGDVRSGEKLVDPRGVNDDSAGLTHVVVVVGNGTTGEVGEGKFFGGGKVGLLETDNVSFFDKSPKGIEDLAFTFKTGLGGSVVGKAVNIVGEEMWGASSRSRERKVGAVLNGIGRGRRRSPGGVGERGREIRGGRGRERGTKSPSPLRRESDSVAEVVDGVVVRKKSKGGLVTLPKEGRWVMLGRSRRSGGRRVEGRGGEKRKKRGAKIGVRRRRRYDL